MKRIQPQPLSISRMCLCLAIAMCCPAIPSQASVQPELTTAIRHKDIRQVHTLLSEGVNFNERDEGDEQTPLMWAAQVGDISIVQTLLHYNVNINAIDDSGNSALKLALQKGHTAIARLLIQKGAKGTITANGTRPARVAASQNSGTSAARDRRTAALLHMAPHRQVRRSTSGAILTLR